MRRAAGGQPVDRRTSLRKDARVPINMNPPNISARTQDLSLGGMKVRVEITPTPFQMRDEVMFLVNQPYFNFHGQGEILWTSPKDGTVGIKFTQLDEEARRSLEEFLSLFVHVPTETVEKASQETLVENAEENDLPECATINDLTITRGHELPKNHPLTILKGFSTVSPVILRSRCYR